MASTPAAFRAASSRAPLVVTTRNRVSAQASTRWMFVLPPSALMRAFALSAASGSRSFGWMPACAGALTGEGASTSSASGPAAFRYSRSRFSRLRARAEDGLDAVADHDDSGSAQRLQLLRTDLAWVLQLHAQARDARIEVHDIAASRPARAQSEARTRRRPPCAPPPRLLLALRVPASSG